MNEHTNGIRFIPKQARSTKTRDRLIAEGATLYRTVGRDRLTTAEVAAAAGVAIGTFYRYFADRVALLNAVAPDRDQSPYPELSAEIVLLENDLRTARVNAMDAHADDNRSYSAMERRKDRRIADLEQQITEQAATIAAVRQWRDWSCNLHLADGRTQINWVELDSIVPRIDPASTEGAQ